MKGLTLADVAESQRNNFRIIRHLAALMVIVAHSVGLLTSANMASSTFEITRAASAMAVNVFFVASGFLVTRSLIRRGNIADYLLSRALRIYPGLIVLVILTAFVWGPLLTTLPVKEYFSSKTVYGFVTWDSIMFVPHHFRYQLPGVLTQLHSRYGDTVNGSLWTLSWELWMYLSLACAYKFRLLGKSCVVLAAVILTAFACIAPSGLDTDQVVNIAIRFTAFFYSGAVLYRYRDLIPLNGRTLALTTAIFTATWWIFLEPVLLPLWLAYVVLFAAYHPRLVLERWCEGPDYSYGLYIYAYPLQQTLILITGVASTVLHVAISVAVTLPFAMMSWHFIEAPSLRLKRRIRRKQVRAPRSEIQA